MRHLLSIALMFIGLTAWADTVEGVIVTSGDTQAQFPISEIKEITFTDEQMTIYRTDETDVSFPGLWSLTFGEIETTGMGFINADMPATIYSLDGTVVADYKHISEFNPAYLPHGVYIIRTGNKSIKIQR